MSLFDRFFGKRPSPSSNTHLLGPLPSQTRDATVLDVLKAHDAQLNSYLGAVGDAVDDIAMSIASKQIQSTAPSPSQIEPAMNATLRTLESHFRSAGIAFPSAAIAMSLRCNLHPAHRLSKSWACYARSEIGCLVATNDDATILLSAINPAISQHTQDVRNLLSKKHGISATQARARASSGTVGETQLVFRDAKWWVGQNPSSLSGPMSVPSGRVTSRRLDATQIARLASGIPEEFSGVVRIGQDILGLELLDPDEQIEVRDHADLLQKLYSLSGRYLLDVYANRHVAVSLFPNEPKYNPMQPAV